MVSPKLAPDTHAGSVSGERPSSFRAWRHRDYRLMGVGQLVSVTGSQMQWVAINWHVYLLTAVSSAAVAFEAPARQALLPALVPPEDFQNAVSLYLIVFHVSMIAGPAIAGLLLGLHSPALIYAINAASFLAVICALLMIRASGRATASGEEAARVSFSALREGLSFVRRTPVIVQTMTLDFIATFFASATALLPIFATEILHVDGQDPFEIRRDARSNQY
jgi:Transmembrane secretion effector